MTNKDYIAAVFGAIMGITAIVVTFPWMTSVGERLAKDAAAYVSDKIQKNKKSTIIAAGGVTYNLVTSDGAKQIGNKSVELLNKKLEQMLEDPVKAAKEGKPVVEEVNKK